MSTSDPILALGDDVFVNVLEYICVSDLLSAEQVSKAWNNCVEAHSSSLWRSLAIQAGVEQVDVDACDALVKTGIYPLGEYDRRAIANNVYRLLGLPSLGTLGRAGSVTTLEGQHETNPRVDWRYVVRSHISLQSAWGSARCRQGWVTPAPNIAWRIKSDAANDVLIVTSRLSGPLGVQLAGAVTDLGADGLAVVDRYTSEPLFSIPHLQGYSHLEAGRGLIAFNRERTDLAFEVWRNADARERTKHIPVAGRSNFASSAVSYSHPDDEEEFRPMDPESPLPRGHYEHYQTLIPPATGRAYRLYVDSEGTKDAKAVLATCAVNAIYIWHLEEEGTPMDTIERGLDDQGSPNYIELDDAYVFVCDDWQIHVYLRETRSHVVSFPEILAPPKAIARLGFSLSITDDFKAIPDNERTAPLAGTRAEGVPAPVGRAVVEGAVPGERRFDEVINRAIAMHTNEDHDDVLYGFSACHFTSRDLICTAEAGCVLIVRDYKDVLAQCSRMEELEPPTTLEAQRTRHVAAAQRATHVADNTIVLGLGTTVKQLTTYADHVIFATSFNVVLLDGRSFPDIPVSPDWAERPTAEPSPSPLPLSPSKQLPGPAAPPRPARPHLPIRISSSADTMDLDSDATAEPSTSATEAAQKKADKEADRATRPTLRAHVLLGNHQGAMKMSSCLQADARSIYLTYWAGGELETDPHGVDPEVHAAAIAGLGLCVKTWTFSVEE